MSLRKALTERVVTLESSPQVMAMDKLTPCARCPSKSVSRIHDGTVLDEYDREDGGVTGLDLEGHGSAL